MGAPPTDHSAQSSSSPSASHVRIVCRCCLSEEDEMTNFLPLDAATSTSYPFHDDGVNTGGDSSAPPATTTAPATLLDCLNGCARIGATLEDKDLPLHICLDCCQALEACCEFIRCVQNADKILRRKRMPPATSAAASVVGVISAAVTGKAGDLPVPSVKDGGMDEDQELMPIGSLSLLDLIDDSKMEMVDFSMGNSSKENVTSCSTSVEANNSFGLDSCNIIAQLPSNNVNEFNPSGDSSLSETPLLSSNYEAVNVATFISAEIPIALNENIAATITDSETAQLPQGNEKNSIPDTHKFISPYIKNTKRLIKTPLNNNSILIKDSLPFTTQECNQLSSSESIHENHVSHLAAAQNTDSTTITRTTTTTTEFAIFPHSGRKYVVNAAIANDLEIFHEENRSKSEYLCKFCIFKCGSQSELDQHMIKHLGSTCYSCSGCSFKCRFKYYLMKHLKDAHNAAISNISVQPEQQNETNETATKFFCGICQRYFNSFIDLQKHHHFDEDPLFQCTFCAAQETEREQLMEHLAEEHKVFIDAHLIAAYLPVATEASTAPESPTKTPASPSPSATTKARTKSEATNAYLNKLFLSQFIKFHTKEDKVTTHLCKYCGRHFKRLFHLLKHEHYNHHSEDQRKENENIFKRRPNKAALQQYTRHLLRSGRSEHRFKCRVCECDFETYAELSVHTQQHREKQFECSTCRAVFSFEFELKYHMRTHDGSGPEYHVAELSWNGSYRRRLQALRQHRKQPRKLPTSSAAKRKSPHKRQASLAAASTTKSSEEGSLDSPPDRPNSDEDMSPASAATSANQGCPEDDISDPPAVSVVDVMLPQEIQCNNLNGSSASTSAANAVPFAIHDSVSSSPSSSSSLSSSYPRSSSATSPASCITNCKDFNCDSSDQTYLNDFDLNLFDCSEDFWLHLSSF